MSKQLEIVESPMSAVPVCETSVRTNEDVYGLEGGLQICEIFSVYDTLAARKCLRNKRVLLLGDSTMTETMHDLIIILSGANVSEAEQYMHMATRSSSLVMLEDGTTTRMFPNHRNMTSYVPSSNTTLIHRFTGHHDFTQNYGGIDSFSHSDFQSTLSCLLGELVGCPNPDLVLVNSGLHDVRIPAEFAERVAQLATRLRRTNLPLIFWKGNIYNPRINFLDAYDISARFEFERRGKSILNIRRTVNADSWSTTFILAPLDSIIMKQITIMRCRRT
jgi:hypothetical protein